MTSRGNKSDTPFGSWLARNTRTDPSIAGPGARLVDLSGKTSKRYLEPFPFRILAKPEELAYEREYFARKDAEERARIEAAIEFGEQFQAEHFAKVAAELRQRLDDAERRELDGQPQEDVDLAVVRHLIEGGNGQ